MNDHQHRGGGGGTAYAIRTATPPALQPGDRVRGYVHAFPATGPVLVRTTPAYGTIREVLRESDPIYLVAFDDGSVRYRLPESLTFHGRPHPAYGRR